MESEYSREQGAFIYGHVGGFTRRDLPCVHFQLMTCVEDTKFDGRHILDNDYVDGTPCCLSSPAKLWELKKE
jgi:hypothetical protein